ncbi:MAG: DUF5818 domain-containing protein [Candidatus Xenobia bacterium]
MQTLRGTVKHVPLEGGLWILESEDGRKYQLLGGGPDLMVNGAAATVQGRLAKDQMGFGMAYPLFEVRTYSIARGK